MSSIRAASAAALWSAAYLAGASADDVLTALADTGFRAGVRAGDQRLAEETGLPGPGCAAAGQAELLPLFRRGGAPELLLPVAGDLRGLGGGANAAMLAALDAGAAVVLPAAGVGLVPLDGMWRAYRMPGGAAVPSHREAAVMLDEAVAEATRRLLRLDVARGGDAARGLVAQAMRAHAVHVPPGTPRGASGLLARAISLEALLAVAAQQDSAAVNRHQLAAVDDTLRHLGRVLRDCRRAAVACAVSGLLAASDAALN